MDYEKLYKDALSRAKNLRNDAIDMGENLCAKQCEIIFPELKGSGDEKIRKEILFIVKEKKEETGDRLGVLGMSYDDMIAWLEKQGNDSYLQEKIENFTNAHKGEDPEGIIAACRGGEKQGEKTVIGNGSNSASVSDGDTSVTNKEVVSQQTGWSKEDTDFKTESVRYLCNLRDTFEESKWDTKPIQRCINWLLEFPKPQFYWKPSKEQMKALYDSIPEKVMEISERAMLLNELYKDLMKLPNAPKQEVNEEEIIAKHITNDSLFDVVNDRLNKCGWYVTEKHSNLESIGENWSEEDERIINKILCICNDFKRSFKISPASTEVIQKDVDKVEDWLKSLKERVQPQPKQEWSGEDERIHQCLIRDQEKSLDDVRNDKYGHSEIISDLKEMYRERIGWLKYLKERMNIK